MKTPNNAGQRITNGNLMKFRRVIVMAMLILIAGVHPSGADQPVRMAYLQNDIHHLACWVALDKKLYEQHGVTVDIRGVFRAGPEIMTAFAAGELDMAYVGEAPTTAAVANKATTVVAVAQVNTEGSAIVVAKANKDITQVSDLKGKTIAVPGHSTVQDFLLRKALTRHDIDLKAVNIIVIKPPEMITALGDNQIDAFISWEPYPSRAGSLDIGKNLTTSHEIWPNHPCCVLVADSKFRDTQPEKVKAVVQAHIQANEFIHQHPREALAIGVKYTGMDEKTVRTAMATVNYTEVLSIDGEMEYVQFLNRLGYIKVDDQKAFVDRLLDGQFLEK